MKCLRVLFLFVVVLFCGSVASHAQNFHVQVLDPSCVTTPDAACTLFPPDLGVPFNINLTAQTCSDQVSNLPGGVLPASPFGCFVGTNDTGSPLNSVDISFLAGPLGGAGCDTNIPGGAFSQSSCTPPGPGDADYHLLFTGGAIINSRFFIILETGLPAEDFIGSATVATAPEPDSILLLSTGAMMAGLYLTKQRRLLAFLKK